MARIKLENDEISVEIDELGAQMVSLVDKKTGKEYMWCADPKFWGKCSPVLFPFVGRCINKEYSYRGKTYQMTPHGFASDSVFSVSGCTKESATFTLKDTEETLKVYPFKFNLDITFSISGRSVKADFKVKNETGDEMYFMLGAHPGFVCPINEGERRRDCFVLFHDKDEIVSRGVDLEQGLVNEVYTVFELKDGYLPISDNLFDGDALVMENQGINKVSLAGADRKPYVTMTMDAPVYGIWSCFEPGTPYVCIEPWLGRCDRLGSDGVLQNRDFVNRLEKDEEFNTSYLIEI
ncbi:MAG: aldose 1-epimerase family protein [Lachnospiraceae bacterium]|nr:aldose 1-epimerase family protein [Lachnospiraceae bacterium]